MIQEKYKYSSVVTWKKQIQLLNIWGKNKSNNTKNFSMQERKNITIPIILLYMNIYGPTSDKNTREFAHRCIATQRHAKESLKHNPMEKKLSTTKRYTNKNMNK